MKKLFVMSIWICTLLFISCAITPHKPVPITREKIAIKISAQGASNWTDVPAAGYKIPKSHIVVISKKTTSASESGALFLGVLPLLAIQLSGPEEGKKEISDAENALQFDLAEAIDHALMKKLQQGHLPPNWAIGGGGGVHLMEIKPYIIMYIDDKLQGRPYVSFKTRLLKEGRREVWWTRYTYFIPETRPFIGKDSWTEDSAKPLTTAIDIALSKILDVMSRDAQGEGAWKKTSGKLRVRYAWYDFNFKGEFLDETEELVVFNIPAKATYLYGINIVPRSQILDQSR